MKKFLIGIVALILIAIAVYVFFTIGLIVLSIAVATALVAALMVWVTSFFVLRKQGHSVFSRYSTTSEDGTKTIIDVEFTEVERKHKKNGS